MKISKVKVKNYRNIEDIDIDLNRLVIFIGDNNSGKSNLLKAITFPFLNSEVGGVTKNLGWNDINHKAKQSYFEFIERNLESIKNNTIPLESFVDAIPIVSVQVHLLPEVGEEFYVKKWILSIDEEDKTEYAIQYIFHIEKTKELLEHVRAVLEYEDSIENIKMNLLPIELYTYSIIVPSTKVSAGFSDLNQFKYNSLAAERDDFSNKHNQLGSKALVSLLNSKLTEEQKVKVEISYERFFDELKGISNLDGIFNWQNRSEIENAKAFFEEITLLPNMPSMNSLLNNVRLGYGEEYLHTQGLGYRNLVYLLVMMNSLENNEDDVLNLLTIEEPEAHLCVSNERLLSSFINSTISNAKNTQLFISTHSPEFLNKLELKNVVVVTEGNAFSLMSCMKVADLDYLAKKPNLDFLKYLFSRKCVLVEGPTEEMLIKSYLANQKNSLNDIYVISLHKGFTKMIDLWLKVNEDSSNMLGIIRDFDNQPKAQENHEQYNQHTNICIKTTDSYTLETEFVRENGNFKILKKYFEINHSWEGIETPDLLSDKWRAAKTDVMLRFCQDIGSEDLKEIKLPQHIAGVLHFLETGEKA
ncbi:ATP-dependent nuclease [Paenisporosarcina sp. NPDC076898]|uniref:ATP-dependent nuclease n=1 Tax=unclassified Paenisporosarcina TaxID=2642018 RepID=UPI003D085728